MIDMNNKQEVIDKLKELKEKNLPKLNFESLKNYKNGRLGTPNDEELEVIEEYLNKFYNFTESEDNKCLFTEQSPILNWGIAHGTAYDAETGLSWEQYHYLTIDGKEKKIVMNLQYHPDCYDIDE